MLNHRLLKFKPDGSFVKKWRGLEINFYGPRDIAIAPNKQIYILDQGRTHVVKFDPKTEQFTEWEKMEQKRANLKTRPD